MARLSTTELMDSAESAANAPETIGERDRRTSDADRALRRIVAEIVDGLRHGYFEYSVTCEVIGRGRRRLVLRAGKNYQFVIAANECELPRRSTIADDQDADL